MSPSIDLMAQFDQGRDLFFFAAVLFFVWENALIGSSSPLSRPSSPNNFKHGFPPRFDLISPLIIRRVRCGGVEARLRFGRRQVVAEGKMTCELDRNPS